MPYYLYILFSEKIDKYYIGYTQNTAERLKFHNSEQNRIWTKRGQPWVLKRFVSYTVKSDAMRAEKRLKSLKSRIVIEEVIRSGRFY